MSVTLLPANLIWATRGRSWGFRFLLDGGFSDPLPPYEAAFQGLADEPTACHREGERVAVRIMDPLGRRDSAGRVIPHEFLVLGELGDAIDSAEDGERELWPLVADVYARVWDASSPPTAGDLGLTSR
ncbi:hypothetical protein GCM10011492_05810 [Flexivirga endophytica]|uniref:Uncharacterized protein n=1 Tax=Flexivirga endophytica TaxID=1849103 RepID=A0A916WPR5_9MICO|nr:hypothetical protein GCM10011492_05810 [Flexivirga endophytica]GHB36877.1 hypothetical protein GCM10008112_01790 [Flexivirga endophytica]